MSTSGKRHGKVYNYTEEEFKQFIKESHSLIEVVRKVGYQSNNTGGAYQMVKQRIKELDLCTEHFTGQAHLRGKTHDWTKRVYSNEGVFKQHSVFKTLSLKKRMIKEYGIPYECVRCHNKGQWKREKLTLQLDHIDGDSTNNQLDNLRFLCPNCHSQTATWGAKRRELSKQEQAVRQQKRKQLRENKLPVEHCLRCLKVLKTRDSKTKKCQKCLKFEQRKVERPTKEVLKQLLLTNSYCAVGRMFGVSDNAIRKWLR